MEVFERWTSLGSWCLPKFQINRYIVRNYFGLQENSTALANSYIKSMDRSLLRQINGGTTILEWIAIKDYKKIIAHIETRFENYSLDIKNLREVLDDDGKIKNIECELMGALFPHLFSSENHYALWNTEINLNIPRIEKMKSEFIGLEKFNTLYIILANSTSAISDFPNRIVEALKKSRHQKSDEFKLLVCVEGDWAPEDTDIIRFRSFDPTSDDPNYPYLGSATSWDRVFEDFRLVAPLPSEL